MIPPRPRLGSRNATTRPLAVSHPTPSQLQHEAPDHAARRRTAPLPLRFSARTLNAWRSSWWHDHDVAPATCKTNPKKSSSMQHFAMYSGMDWTRNLDWNASYVARVVGKTARVVHPIYSVYTFVSMRCKWLCTRQWPAHNVLPPNSNLRCKWLCTRQWPTHNVLPPNSNLRCKWLCTSQWPITASKFKLGSCVDWNSWLVWTQVPCGLLRYTERTKIS
jgi:hypothetical protein